MSAHTEPPFGMSTVKPDANRPKSHRLGLAAFAIILLMTALALPVLGIASEMRSGGTVTIEATELIDDDLYVAAGEFILEGRTNGDVLVAAGRIDVPGSVIGSLNIAGGETDVDGEVGRSVRILGGDTVLSGDIGGDLVIFGGRTEVQESVSIGGDLLIYGGELDLRGDVLGSVKGTVGSMTIGGRVDGDIDLDVQSLEVTTGAEIDRLLQYVSRQEADIAPGADIGEVQHTETAPWGTGDGFRAQLFSPLVRTLWLLAAGVALVVLAPRLSAAVSGNVSRPWIPAIIGLLTVMLLPVIAIVLMISVIGLPVGLILLVLFVIALYLSQVVVGQRIGTLLLPRRWNDGSRGFLLLAMTLGVILISAFRFVPLPFVSAVVNLVVAVLGLGAVVLLVRQLRPAYQRDV